MGAKSRAFGGFVAAASAKERAFRGFVMSLIAPWIDAPCTVTVADTQYAVEVAGGSLTTVAASGLQCLAEVAPVRYTVTVD